MGIFNKILIANRGEIAVRIIRTAKRMGIGTVSIYAVDDHQSLHVSLADEAVLLEGKSLNKTYLNQELIIQIAKKLGADAIHPGYGFLSENAVFADKVEKSGLSFIGASSTQIELMGEKNKSNDFVQKLNIPIVPRIKGSINNIPDFAQDLSFPLLVKASAGGGGKGMVVVEKLEDLPHAMKQAQRQALEYFGNDDVFVEKYLPDVRHIEVQIFGDGKGNAIHLFERECTIQRRYQKIIEEAPSISISKELKEELYQSALKIAEAIKYRGAGTIEFLVDDEENFYFLEMNTRLQVEHPVTEMITGLDLVEWQIRVSAGAKLPLNQSQIVRNGYAMEFRICAENPMENFRPTSGVVQKIRTPNSSSFRFESFVSEGMKLSSNYDSLIAKMVVWDKNRQTVLERIKESADEFLLTGITTNWAFLQQIIKNKCFIKNEINTRFVENEIEQLKGGLVSERQQLGELIPVIAYVLHHFVFPKNETTNLWGNSGYWRIAQELLIFVDEKPLKVSFKNQIEGLNFLIKGSPISITEMLPQENGYSFKLDNDTTTVVVADTQKQTWVQYKEHEFKVRSNHLMEQIVLKRKHESFKDEKRYHVYADLFGKIVETTVKPGEQVEKDQLLLIIESMKTEFRVLSPGEGVVKNVFVEAGSTVHDKQLLIEFEVENKITINA
ncbi:acetyl/propionyl/methylcrotonyl-CoA carboxylase subunit alpha [Sunxiuqinia sp. A32]|uniref:acetyl/propionyl/methylcrotonyl-CoA carboxylase subunit alpha n=1 Tax=Sunxiuqinia sp. A32 TaxID=3461496 RepID=UPI004046451F